MKTSVTLKTLQQHTFKIDIEDEETVRKLKESIEASKGAKEFPVAGQKLIYAGKILEDEKTIKECNIEPSNFIVVMVTKPKAAPTNSKPAESQPSETSSTSTAAAATPAPAQTPTPAPAPAPVQETTPPAPPAEKMEESPPEEKKEEASAAASDSAQGESSSSSTAPSGATCHASELDEASSRLATGSQYDQAIASLVEMGFPREVVMRAMTKAYNCPDRAAEFLFSGEVRDEPAPAPAPTAGQGSAPAASPATGVAPTPQQVSSLGGSTGGGGNSGSSDDVPENPLAFLREQPHFRQMREMVQSNPASLTDFLHQIGLSNPQLLAIINANQQQFVNMLNEPDDPQGGGPGTGGGGAVPNIPTVQITQQDKAAIDRLRALGFNEMVCIQAYLACERDEQVAANLLFTQGFDDEENS